MISIVITESGALVSSLAYQIILCMQYARIGFHDARKHRKQGVSFIWIRIKKCYREKQYGENNTMKFCHVEMSSHLIPNSLDFSIG